MNLTSPTEIKKLLEEIGAKPSKYYGQNFLINKGILEKIINASEIKKDDIILEVGPGPGALTKKLSKKAKRVIVVEKDRNMIKILEKVLKEENIKNVKVINEDILKLDLGKTICKGFSKLSAVGGKSEEKKKPYSKSTALSIEAFYEQMRQVRKPYKLVANIPYYLTSALIRKFLEEKTPPKKIILMIQKEVAQRICKKNKMSLLSLSVQFYAKPKILFYVSKGSFFPAPKVDSAVIEIIPKKTTPMESEIFFKFIKAGFSSPRKQLASNLAENYDLSKDNFKKIFEKINLDPRIRAEDLTLKNWIILTQYTNSNLEAQPPSL